MIELPKPCPFCGEKENLQVHVFPELHGVPDAYVQCEECTTCGPDGGDRAGAIAKWNHRWMQALVLTDEQILDEASHHGFLGSQEQLLKFVRGLGVLKP